MECIITSLAGELESIVQEDKRLTDVLTNLEKLKADLKTKKAEERIFFSEACRLIRSGNLSEEEISKLSAGHTEQNKYIDDLENAIARGYDDHFHSKKALEKRMKSLKEKQGVASGVIDIVKKSIL